MAVVSFSKLFAPAMLTTSAALIFTVPGPSSSILNNGRVRCTNVSASPVKVTLYAIPEGDTASDTNAIVKEYTIAANDYAEFNLPTMKYNDFLHGLCDTATAVNIQQAGGGISS